ncbi:MAG: GNAT family N-acetyltransferase [Oscillospiraceae bacterium]|nr:GNAT family N-acetyltransferase [Oscillospiraceae bacterium]
MVKEYASGEAFLAENRPLLDTDKYRAVFFYGDAELIRTADKENYALRAEDGEETLLAIRAEPFATVLFGSPALAPELFGYIADGGLKLGTYLCGEDVGDAAAAFLAEKYGLKYSEGLAMDFMEATDVTEPSSDEVEVPSADDLDEICELLERFIADCGLLDTVDRDGVERTIDRFRVLREDGLIVSMAKSVPSTEGSARLSDVYTRPEYRGQGLARRVVNTLKNEILAAGNKATLNVDKANPYSNRLYASLGFKKLFSQGEYRKAL